MSENNIKPFLSKLKLIHLALLGGQVIFLFVVYFLTQMEEMQGGIQAESVGEEFKIILGFVVLSALGLSQFLFQSLLKQSKAKEAKGEKLQMYQTAFIVRVAVLEGAGIFSIILFLLSGDLIYAFIALVPMVVSALHHPSIFKIENDLGVQLRD